MRAPRGQQSPQWRPNVNEDFNVTPTGTNVNGGPPMSPSRGSTSPQWRPNINEDLNITPMEAQRQ